MASIATSNLHPTGLLLFPDKETFLNKLSDEQADMAYLRIVVQPTTIVSDPISIFYTLLLLSIYLYLLKIMTNQESPSKDRVTASLC